MKRLLTILLTCLLVLPALAQGEGVKKVAILEVVDREGTVSYGVKLQLRSSLTAAITQTPGYEAYDRVDMAAIFGEHDFQRTGVVNNDQIKKLGEMSGCDYVLITEAAPIDANNLIIVAKVVDVTTARVESSEDNMVSLNANGIRKGGQELAKKLFAPTIQMVQQAPQRKVEVIEQTPTPTPAPTPASAPAPMVAQNTATHSTTTYNTYGYGRQIPYGVRPGMRYKEYVHKYSPRNYDRSVDVRYSPWLAATNFLIPGLGEMCCGEFGRGLMFTGISMCGLLVDAAMEFEDGPMVYVITNTVGLWLSVFDTIKVAKVKSMYYSDMERYNYGFNWSVSPSVECIPTYNGLQTSAGMKLTMTF